MREFWILLWEFFSAGTLEFSHHLGTVLRRYVSQIIFVHRPLWATDRDLRWRLVGLEDFVKESSQSSEKTVEFLEFVFHFLKSKHTEFNASRRLHFPVSTRHVNPISRGVCLRWSNSRKTIFFFRFVITLYSPIDTGKVVRGITVEIHRDCR